MMVNRPRDKGTQAENMVVEYLLNNGWPYAERRSLKGINDKGDVTGCPGLVWETKWAGSGLRVGPWLTETAVERLNAGADHGILVIKPRGLGAKSAGYFYAVMQFLDHESLRDQAPGALLSVSEPHTFDAVTMQLELQAHETSFGAMMPCALTMVPPGAKEKPDRWYRIMYLRDVVRLLRQAGYGTPIVVAET